jgi:DNA-binding transcriptional MocR family regulator
LPEHELQLGSGTWFGESRRVFRLGFGYLPPERLGLALSALSSVLDAALK